MWWLVESASPVAGAEDLHAGDRVKLHFMTDVEPDPPVDPATGRALPWRFGGELPWVEVLGSAGPGRWSGAVKNRLLGVFRWQGLDQGAMVTFGSRNVVALRRAGLLERVGAALRKLLS